jgi:flagellar biosynthesis chaperone FliJ
LNAVTAAASQRLELLKKEQEEFERNLASKAENDIPGKETQLGNIDQQLANLQVQMDSLRRQRDQLAHDIEQVKQRLEHSRSQFTGAQVALKSQLEQDLARIQTHLKA